MPEGFSHLTREQRNHIRRYRGIMPIQQIADDLRVHRSTVYRELKRNSDGSGRYEDDTAHRRACERRSCASRRPRKIPPDFIDTFVFHRLENRHSSDVIANTLPPSAPSISTRWLYELIDRAIFSRSILNISTAFPAGFSISSHHRSCSTRNSLPSRSPIPVRRHPYVKKDAISRFAGPCASITHRPH